MNQDLGEEQLSDIVDVAQAVARGERDLRSVLGLSPKILEQLVDQALAFHRHGRSAEGEQLLEKLSVVDRESAMLPFLLGTIRASTSDHEGAVAAYTESLERDERATALAFRAEVLLLRGRSQLMLGLLEEARADFHAVSSSGIERLKNQADLCLSALEGTDEDQEH